MHNTEATIPIVFEGWLDVVVAVHKQRLLGWISAVGTEENGRQRDFRAFQDLHSRVTMLHFHVQCLESLR